MIISSKFHKIFLLVTACLVGYIFGYLQFGQNGLFTKPIWEITEIRSKENAVYTNPLIECEQYSTSMTPNVSIIERNVNDYVNNSKAGKNIDEIAVYFRDLDKGKWFGINENIEFAPASLVKIPVVVNYVKESENDPAVLSKKLTLNENLELDLAEQNGYQYYKPEKKIEIGKEYTVEELITYSLEYSDNNAHALLVTSKDFDEFTQTIKDLDLYGSVQKPYDTISVKDYSSIFRILYNATYLSQKNSEWVLSILAQGRFDKGLRKGVPQDVPVANKFGEKGYIYENPDPNKFSTTPMLQLHDCGIIYDPDNPYLLCIMTHGSDYSAQEKVIQNISKIVYEGLNE